MITEPLSWAISRLRGGQEGPQGRASVLAALDRRGDDALQLAGRGDDLDAGLAREQRNGIGGRSGRNVERPLLGDAPVAVSSAANDTPQRMADNASWFPPDLGARPFVLWA
jgi:hypothetical protein